MSVQSEDKIETDVIAFILDIGENCKELGDGLEKLFTKGILQLPIMAVDS